MWVYMSSCQRGALLRVLELAYIPPLEADAAELFLSLVGKMFRPMVVKKDGCMMVFSHAS